MARQASKKSKQKQRTHGKTIVIRDPIHGYVRVAPHERIVVDHPITQRLRHVLQTGLAYLIFPEARTSRFVHSLGAMHLASRFLLACVENAERSTAEAFFAALQAHASIKKGLVKLEEFDLLWAPEEPGTQTGLLSSRAVFPGRLSSDEERRRRRLLTFAEAGLRLAALFHDLGHLPFSHDLEIALDAFDKRVRKQQQALPPGMEQVLFGNVPPHEKIGHQLSKLVLRSLVQPSTSPAIRAVYALAQEILDTEPPYEDKTHPRANVLEWMHSLIDGEVDVDRADYLLRDGRALGFEFAAYDLERLVDHLTLVREEHLGFATAIHEAGLSALETFFVSRARSNQAMVRHHKNAQAGAAFRYASITAFETQKGQEFLRAIGRLFDPKLLDAQEKVIPHELEGFSRFDDGYWVQALREAADAQQPPLLNACLKLVLQRGDSLRSLWKRKGDVPDGTLRKLNEVLASNEPMTQRELARRQEALHQRGVLVISHKFKPFRVFSARPDPQKERETYSVMLVRTDERGLLPAARLSPLIRALKEAWDDEPHMHAFALKSAQVDTLDIINELVQGLPFSSQAKRKGT